VLKELAVFCLAYNLMGAIASASSFLGKIVDLPPQAVLSDDD
jgi:hypothetical protein